MRLYQTKTFLHRKGNHPKKRKGNLCHLHDKELITKIYKELIQFKSKKKKKPTKKENTHTQITDFKMDKRSKLIFFQRRYTNGQQVHEKVLNITNHQENANQNHNEISPYTS